MTTATLTPAVREGFTTVTPYIWVPDRGLADFLVRTFDAVETGVGEIPGQGVHRELRIGNSMVMIRGPALTSCMSRIRMRSTSRRSRPARSRCQRPPTGRPAIESGSSRTRWEITGTSRGLREV
ncbi:MAG TPA: hypothetical protein VM818_03005 [Vicinamibacterales bacterium]|nr:hypothetical protein [Vicinamibacterales bacterium]